ncbi:hypothetical protein BX666DRAFT_1846419, partial [Dichotomocladium elegans]
STSALSSPLTPAACRLFWSFSLSPGVRNIWFRILHGTLPTSERLHLFNPTLMPSPACQICDPPQDTTEHFLFLCPPKWQTWQNLWAPVYLADPDHAAVLTALNTMDFPLDSLAQRNRRVRLISAILQAVWTAHWAHIFDATPM